MYFALPVEMPMLSILILCKHFQLRDVLQTNMTSQVNTVSNVPDLALLNPLGVEEWQDHAHCC
jgi:hypothetical protein